MDELREQCGRCRFSAGDEHADRLLCRRYPPTVVTLGARDIFGERRSTTGLKLPVVAADEWCGEFQPVVRHG